MKCGGQERRQRNRRTTMMLMMETEKYTGDEGRVDKALFFNVKTFCLCSRAHIYIDYGEQLIIFTLGFYHTTYDAPSAVLALNVHVPVLYPRIGLVITGSSIHTTYQQNIV